MFLMVTSVTPAGYMRDRDRYNLHLLNYIMFASEIAAMLLSFRDSLAIRILALSTGLLVSM